MTLPNVEIGHMDLTTGRYVRDGEASMVYLTVCGVRIRVDVHRFAGEPEASIVVDPWWTEDNHVNALDVIEVQGGYHQATLRVRGK